MSLQNLDQPLSLQSVDQLCQGLCMFWAINNSMTIGLHTIEVRMDCAIF